eukprot:6207292-Pleurochrysis_carterae.AAC.2
MKGLQERIDMLNKKETQLDEIKQMLRMMESAVGVEFVDDKDQITSSAWVFVGLNVLIFLYVGKVLLVDPIAAAFAS